MIYADNVKETTTSTSAASITTAGAAPNYQAFSVFTVGQTNIAVKVGPDSNGAWLVGAYTYSAANTLTRTAILSSSAGGADVTFAAGSKDVICTLPASKVVDVDNAVTVTNKRITPRVVTSNAPGATPTFNTDNADRVKLTGIAANITSMTTNCTGTPTDGDSLVIDFESAGTYSIGWGTKFEDSSISAPLNTVAGKKLSVYFDWNTTTSKWRCMGYA